MHQEASNMVKLSYHNHERVPPLPIGDMSVDIEPEEGNEQLNTIISRINFLMH